MGFSSLFAWNESTSSVTSKRAVWPWLKLFNGIECPFLERFVYETSGTEILAPPPVKWADYPPCNHTLSLTDASAKLLFQEICIGYRVIYIVTIHPASMDGIFSIKFAALVIISDFFAVFLPNPFASWGTLLSSVA